MEYGGGDNSFTLEENARRLLVSEDNENGLLNIFDRFTNDTQRVLVEPVSLIDDLPPPTDCVDVPGVSDLFGTGNNSDCCLTEEDSSLNLTNDVTSVLVDEDVSSVASRILLEGIAEENFQICPITSEEIDEQQTKCDEEITKINGLETVIQETDGTPRESSPQLLRTTSPLNTSFESSSSVSGPPTLRRSQRRLERELRLSADEIRRKNIEEEAKYLKAKQNSIGDAYSDSTRKRRSNGQKKMKTVEIKKQESSEEEDEDDKPLAKCVVVLNKLQDKPKIEITLQDKPKVEIMPQEIKRDETTASESSSEEEGVEEQETEEISVSEPMYCFNCAKIGLRARMVVCDQCKNSFHKTCQILKRSLNNAKERLCDQCRMDERQKHLNLPEHQKGKVNKETDPDIVNERKKRKRDANKTATDSVRREKPTKLCAVCQKKSIESKESIYCGDECIATLVQKALRLFKNETHHVTVTERGGANRTISGLIAPPVRNLSSWLKKHRKFYPVLPNKKPEAAPETPPTPVSVSTTPTPDQVRLAVRKTLRDCFLSRTKDADDVLLSSDEIKRMAVDIENEMYKLYCDTGSAYKLQFKGLVVNLKDLKNRGFFRRILNGTLTARKVAAMSGQEMASRENSFWATSDDEELVLVKKEKVSNDKRKLFTKTKAEADSTCDIFGLLVGDTTGQHKSHLFDLNCKICTGKQKSEEDLMKKVVSNKEQQQTNVEPVAVAVAEVPKKEFAATDRSESNTAKPPVLTAEATLHSPTVNSSTAAVIPQPQKRHRRRSSSTATAPQLSIPPPATAPKPAVAVEEEDFVWRGMLDMPGYFRFHVSFSGVSGLVESLKRDLPTHLKIVGRIPSETVYDYVKSIKNAPSKDLVVIRIAEPADLNDSLQYEGLYSNMLDKGRFCVVDTTKFAKIKDLYFLPLPFDQPADPSLLPFDGKGLPVPRSNLILGIIVRRREPVKHDPPPVPQVPESLKSKLKKNNEEKHLTSSETKIIKFSNSDTEEDNLARNEIRRPQDPREASTAAATVPSTSGAATSDPRSDAVAFPSTSGAATADVDAAKRFKPNEGPPQKPSGENAVNKEEWMKWWSNVLQLWQSTGAAPPTGTWAAPPSSRSQLPPNQNPPPITTSSFPPAPPVQTFSHKPAHSKMPWTRLSNLEDGEIDEDDEDKSKAAAMEKQKNPAANTDWRKLQTTAPGQLSQGSTTSGQQQQQQAVDGRGDVDYRSMKPF